MRHSLNEHSWYDIMLELIRTTLYEDNPNGEVNENIDNTRIPDSDDDLL
jgi:hypothetical protein